MACCVVLCCAALCSCGCPIDGQAGTWCEAVTEQVCPNSCSGHGRCDGGFCVCVTGWFGHDCAGRVEGQQPEAFNESTGGLQAWVAAINCKQIIKKV